MTALDLDAIKARADRASERLPDGGTIQGYEWAARNVASAQDVPALVAEVERLQDQIAKALDAYDPYCGDGSDAVFMRDALTDSSSTGGKL